ncbi:MULTISPECIES: phage Gp37/Gp68 family protein [unclassified Paraburkholderia]|uniref:phage Gp37/Gp68 family protein n=1 Tax=unclassified Paraburkholderia TaxID=2615204 RepID=UPI001612E831|nr:MULTISPECIES: phage Gp37/Gp68 family protein [unclassified Paraburkholderia]MBB5443640.1 protein gp37 [Paraburkholderia sp. WSM4177]MBB5484139.1 protein gp37 [Paraburkholderia sp. WSM4180]
MAKTTIEWTEYTWNPITGCDVTSPGCKNCYAMKLAGTRLRNHASRAGLTRATSAGPVWNGEVRFNEEWLDQPFRWTRPRMVFVCAHGDLFHESVPDEWIDRVFAVMARARQHTYQVLTKRADRMLEYFSRRDRHGLVLAASHDIGWAGMEWCPWPLPNVWIGVSVEDQKRADERIPKLLQVPAVVRWISAEPLLGPVDLTSIQWGGIGTSMLQGWTGQEDGLHWVVAGGESGPGARPMHPDWARSLRDQCAAAGVPFLFKQWGEWRPISEGESDWFSSLYVSRRRAREGEDQAIVDEMQGRRCTVAQAVIHQDGTVFEDIAAFGAYQQGTGAMLTFATGKKAAGRMLDGRTHDEFPGAR